MMRLLNSDLLPVLFEAAKGALKHKELEFNRDASALIVMAANGYPGAYKKGSIIKGVARAEKKPGVVVFHAGAAMTGDQLTAAGGRVLNISATGKTIRDAVERAYAAIEEIDWPEGFYRLDIAWRALKDLV